jgi:hypothetical protein
MLAVCMFALRILDIWVQTVVVSTGAENLEKSSLNLQHSLGFGILFKNRSIA